MSVPLDEPLQAPIAGALQASCLLAGGQHPLYIVPVLVGHLRVGQVGMLPEAHGIGSPRTGGLQNVAVPQSQELTDGLVSRVLDVVVLHVSQEMIFLASSLVEFGYTALGL